jgi:hypothetical protein
MRYLDKLLDIVESPENDGKDFRPLIKQILKSVSSETLIKLLSTAEEQGFYSLIPHLKKEIERRGLDFPPELKN